MTGPEHYREAERIADYAEDHAIENGAEWYANAMAAAQVHATLANAAAAAFYGFMGATQADEKAWREVLS